MGNLQEGAEQTPRISLMVSELSGEAVGALQTQEENESHSQNTLFGHSSLP